MRRDLLVSALLLLATHNHSPFTVPFNVEMDSSWMAVRHRCAKLSLCVSANT